MFLLPFRLLGIRAVDRFAEPAPGLAAALAETAVRTGVLLGDGLFLHILIICLQPSKGKGTGVRVVTSRKDVVFYLPATHRVGL